MRDHEHDSNAAAAEAHGEGEVFDPAPFRPTRRALTWSIAGAALLFGGLLAVGTIPRLLHRSAMAGEERARGEAQAHVTVVRAERAAAGQEISLPGSVQPLQETRVYARVNGYVRRWLVDIGAHVKKGQVLVELDIPDIDEELLQARAAANQTRAGIAQAKTQLELARTTNQRYGALGPSGVVSQQEVAQYQAAYEAQQSNVTAAEATFGSALANVRRLEDLRSFGVITAPFDGVVTLRTAEVGQLVTSGVGTGQPLFKVAEVDTVRVFVNVPQLYASSVTPGVGAVTTVRELPGRTFAGKVARTANELDTGTRTLLTEVDVPNQDDALMAGMYARVSIRAAGPDSLVLLPATAVLIDAQGTRVARVRDGVVSWSKVEIESDLGDRFAVASGVTGGDEVIAAPSDRLVEGMRVVAQRAERTTPAPGDPPRAP